jgi:hypothetical protein
MGPKTIRNVGSYSRRTLKKKRNISAQMDTIESASSIILEASPQPVLNQSDTYEELQECSKSTARTIEISKSDTMEINNSNSNNNIVVDLDK